MEVWKIRGEDEWREALAQRHPLVTLHDVLVLPFWKLDAFPLNSQRHGNKNLPNPKDQRIPLRSFFLFDMSCKLPPLQHVTWKRKRNASEPLRDAVWD